MPGKTISTTFSSLRTIGAPVGGQWQPATGGVATPALPHGFVPTPGMTALGTRQVAQKPALQPNTFPGPTPAQSSNPVPPAGPSLPTTIPGSNVGALVSTGVVGGVSRLRGLFTKAPAVAAPQRTAGSVSTSPNDGVASVPSQTVQAASSVLGPTAAIGQPTAPLAVANPAKGA